MSSKLTVLALLISMQFCIRSHAAKNSSLYIEGGAAYGSFSNGSDFFNRENSASGSGFVFNLGFFGSLTSPREFAHVDLGLDTKMLAASNSDHESLHFAAPHAALRIHFFQRMYLAAAYAPITFAANANEGLFHLHLRPNASAYYFEGGLIWRVMPEFQIVLTYSREYGSLPGGVTSPAPLNEYGLRFRFPLSPSESAHGKGVDFDGFRYPFGFMR